MFPSQVIVPLAYAIAPFMQRQRAACVAATGYVANPRARRLPHADPRLRWR